MATDKIKGASVLFLCWMGLMAAVCVPSFIAGVSCTKSVKPITLLNASVTGLESDSISPSNAVAPDRAEQPGRRQTAEVLDTSLDTHQNALEWNVKYTGVEVCTK